MTLDFPIFAINMDRDVDRWQSVAEQATKFGLNIQRISAIESQNIPTSELSFVTAGVRAVWKSPYEVYATTFRIKLNTCSNTRR